MGCATKRRRATHELVARHIKAFADHAAEFRLEVGGDPDRARLEVFCLLSWSFDGQHLECADLRKAVDEAGIHVVSDARAFSVLLPTACPCARWLREST